MPAESSSPIDPAIGHLVVVAERLADDRAGVLSVLAGLTDPRKRRRVRHRLVAVLGLALCAVLAGARSFVAIAEWAADAGTLAELGVGGVVPCESTIRRTLQNLDADALDNQLGAWAQARTQPSPAVRRRVAVDGKTVRGSGDAGGVPPLALAEDQALVDTLRLCARRLVATGRIPVTTSARREGRTAGGFAGYLRRLGAAEA